MELLDLVQGTDPWHQARKDSDGTASEAPAMMNVSKYMTREQLLDMKKGKEQKPVSKFVQDLYDKGHKAEAEARVIVELEYMEEFTPLVGVIRYSNLNLLASFDGLSEDRRTLFEHKLYNKDLAENVKNKTLPLMYAYQLEHQLFVSGAERVLFVVSDGTKDNWEDLFYSSNKKLRDAMIQGWAQFKIDLETHEIKAKEEAVEGEVMIELPAIALNFAGPDIVSNAVTIKLQAEEWRDTIKAAVAEADAVDLKSEKDFEDRNKTNNALTKIRADLKKTRADIEKAFKDFYDLNIILLDIDSILQKSEASGKKAYKENKDIQKALKISTAKLAANAYVKECNAKVAPVQIGPFITNSGGFDAAIKGKSNLDKMQEAIDAELANVKIEIDQIVERVSANNKFLAGYNSHRHLFSDLQQIANKEPADFENIVKVRVAEFDKAEEERLEAQRERIRLEEEEKAREKVALEESAKKKIADDEAAAEKLRLDNIEKERIANEKKAEEVPVKENQLIETETESEAIEGEVVEEIPERKEAQESNGLTNPEVDHLVKERNFEDDDEPFHPPVNSKVDHSILADGNLTIAMTSGKTATVNIGNGTNDSELKVSFLKFLADLGILPF